MASLRDVQDAREKLFARAAERGFPGLLPCAVNECSDDGEQSFHERVEFVEPSVLRERTGVTIGSARNAKLVTVCPSCMDMIRRVGMFHEV